MQSRKKVDIIIVEGNFAKKIHKTQGFNRNIDKVYKWENETNISTVKAASIATLTGIEIAIIIIAISIGLGVIISLWKGYEEVCIELEMNPLRVKFRSKK